MYIHQGRNDKTHVVVSHCWGQTMYLCDSFEGSRSQCRSYVKNRAKQGLPTHFLYIITNTERARQRLRQKLGI